MGDAVTGCGKLLPKVYNLRRVCGEAGRLCDECSAKLVAAPYDELVVRSQRSARKMLEHHAVAAQLFALIDPVLFERRLLEHERGGLPGDSMPEPSRSADAPMPVTDVPVARDPDTGKVLATEPGVKDAHDRQIEKHRGSYHHDLRQLRRLLERLVETQSWATEKSKAVPDVVDYPCANPNCWDEENPTMPYFHSRPNGECAACRTHRRRYGVQRQKPAERRRKTTGAA